MALEFYTGRREDLQPLSQEDIDRFYGLRGDNVVQQPPAQSGGVVMPALKRQAGMELSNYGRIASDLGLGGQSLITSGRQLQEANPSQIQTAGDVVNKPGTLVAETVGELAPQVPINMVGSALGGLAGAGLGMLFPPAAPYLVPGGAAVGSYLTNLASEYGQIREEQDRRGIDERGRALAAAAPAAVLDLLGPVESVGRKLLTGAGRKALVDESKVGLVKSLGKSAAVEGLTEVAQTPIERLGVTANPADLLDNPDEYAIALAKGTVGGAGIDVTSRVARPIIDRIAGQPETVITTTTTTTTQPPQPAGNELDPEFWRSQIHADQVAALSPGQRPKLPFVPVTDEDKALANQFIAAYQQGSELWRQDVEAEKAAKAATAVQPVPSTVPAPPVVPVPPAASAPAPAPAPAPVVIAQQPEVIKTDDRLLERLDAAVKGDTRFKPTPSAVARRLGIDFEQATQLTTRYKELNDAIDAAVPKVTQTPTVTSTFKPEVMVPTVDKLLNAGKINEVSYTALRPFMTDMAPREINQVVRAYNKAPKPVVDGVPATEAVTTATSEVPVVTDEGVVTSPAQSTTKKVRKSVANLDPVVRQEAGDKILRNLTAAIPKTMDELAPYLQRQAEVGSPVRVVAHPTTPDRYTFLRERDVEILGERAPPAADVQLPVSAAAVDTPPDVVQERVQPNLPEAYQDLPASGTLREAKSRAQMNRRRGLDATAVVPHPTRPGAFAVVSYVDKQAMDAAGLQTDVPEQPSSGGELSQIASPNLTPRAGQATKAAKVAQVMSDRNVTNYMFGEPDTTTSAGHRLRVVMDALRSIVAPQNIEVVFYHSTDKNAYNGFVLPGDASTIYINTASGDPVQVLSHELTHVIELTDAGVYDALADLAMSMTTSEKFNEYRTSTRFEYVPTSQVDEQTGRSELVADVVGYIMSGRGAWDEVLAAANSRRQSRGLMRFLGYVMDAVRRVLAAISGSDRRDATITQFVGDLTKIENDVKELLTNYMLDNVRMTATSSAGFYSRFGRELTAIRGRFNGKKMPPAQLIGLLNNMKVSRDELRVSGLVQRLQQLVDSGEKLVDVDKVLAGAQVPVIKTRTTDLLLYGSVINHADTEDIIGYDEVLFQWPETFVDAGVFDNGHWNEDVNDLRTMGHVRYTVRRAAGGAKVLYVEEVQSDWMQALQKAKRKGEPLRTTNPAVSKLLREYFVETNRQDPDDDVVAQIESKLMKLAADEELPTESMYLNAWEGLLLRGILMTASSKQVDRVEFAGGELQSQRTLKPGTKVFYDNLKRELARVVKPWNIEVDDQVRSVRGDIGFNPIDYVGEMPNRTIKKLEAMIDNEIATELATRTNITRDEYDAAMNRLLDYASARYADELSPRDAMKRADLATKDADVLLQIMSVGGIIDLVPLVTELRPVNDTARDGFGFDVPVALKADIAFNGMPMASYTASNGVTYVSDLKNASKEIYERAKKVGLQFLGRRQLAELAKDALPGVEKYSELMELYASDKNYELAMADELATRWGKLPDAQQRRLAETMREATMFQVDPDLSLKDHRGDVKATDYRKVKEFFGGLNADAKAVFREAHEIYMMQWDAVRSALDDVIEQAEVSEQAKAKLRHQFVQEMMGSTRRIYFPLMHFGDYYVRVTTDDGKTVIHHEHTETKAAADALRAQLVKRFPKYDVSNVQLVRDVGNNDGLGSDAIREIQKLVRANAGDTQTADAINDAIGRLYIQNLPETSWLKHAVDQPNTPGYSTNMRRAFAFNIMHGSNYLNKLRYLPKVRRVLTEMQDAVKARENDTTFDSTRAQRYLNEILLRHEQQTRDNSNPLANLLTSIGFFWHLGLSPAAAAVNLMQTPLVAYPMLGAKYGFDKAFTQLSKAMIEAGKAKNDLLTTLKQDELLAMERGISEGLIDITQAHDLNRIAAGDVVFGSTIAEKVRPVANAATFLFHHGERFNRQVTFLAAYRMEREAGRSADAAYKAAKQLTTDSHFDYSAENRPRVMNGPVSRVLLLFKNYAQNMIYALVKNGVVGKGGFALTSKDPAEREAARVFAGVLTMHAMAAGVLGLPVVGTLLAIASALGSTDDEPWDAEVALRNYLAEAVGSEAAEVVTKGLPRAVPGLKTVDIAGRVGLNNLVFMDQPEAQTYQDWWLNFMSSQLGPVGALPVSFARGLDLVSKGEHARALEMMVPKVFKDTLKSIRYNDEGVLTKDGVAILEDTKLSEELAQLAGFTPARVSLAYEGMSARYEADMARNDRRTSLTREYANAIQEGKSTDRVLDDVIKFNETNPLRAIKGADLRDAARARLKKPAEAVRGVNLNKARALDVDEEDAFARHAYAVRDMSPSDAVEYFRGVGASNTAKLIEDAK